MYNTLIEYLDHWATECPDEIWLRDSDIVLVPQTPLKRLDDLVDLVFKRGINEALPLLYGLEVLTPTVF